MKICSLTPGETSHAKNLSSGWRCSCSPRPPAPRTPPTNRPWCSRAAATPPTFITCCSRPDGKQIVTVSDDHTVRLWDRATGERLAVLRLPVAGEGEGMPGAAALAPDGKTLAVAGTRYHVDDKAVVTVFLIDLDAGAMTATLPGGETTITALAFSHDGKLLAQGDGAGKATVWDVAGRKAAILLEGHKAVIRDAAFSPDDKLLATASADKTARLWDLETGKEACKPLKHDSDVLCLAWHNDNVLFTGGRGSVFINKWDRTGKHLHQFVRQAPTDITSISMLPEKSQMFYTWTDEQDYAGPELHHSGGTVLVFKNDVERARSDLVQPHRPCPWGRVAGRLRGGHQRRRRLGRQPVDPQGRQDGAAPGGPRPDPLLGRLVARRQRHRLDQRQESAARRRRRRCRASARSSKWRSSRRSRPSSTTPSSAVRPGRAELRPQTRSHVSAALVQTGRLAPGGADVVRHSDPQQFGQEGTRLYHPAARPLLLPNLAVRRTHRRGRLELHPLVQRPHGGADPQAPRPLRRGLGPGPVAGRPLPSGRLRRPDSAHLRSG